MSETSWGRRKYRTTNWKAYSAALKARGDLTIWLDKDMQWLTPPTCKRGRCHTFSDTAIQFCLTIKCLFGQPLRQPLGLVQSLLCMAGLAWGAPDYSMVCRRQRSLDGRNQCPSIHSQSIHRAGLAPDGGRGINPSGVWCSSASGRFMQQRLSLPRKFREEVLDVEGQH